MQDRDSLRLLRTALLLHRMKRTPRDSALWVAFMARLRRQVEAICSRRRLQEADAEDVWQELHLRLLRYLPHYSPDQGNPRGWIGRILINLCKDKQRARQRRREQVYCDAIDEPAAVTNEVDDIINAEYDLWERGEAIARVRQWALQSKFPETRRSWEIFSAMLEGEDDDLIVARYEITKTAARTIRCRMKQRLLDAVEQIRTENESLKEKKDERPRLPRQPARPK